MSASAAGLCCAGSCPAGGVLSVQAVLGSARQQRPESWESARQQRPFWAWWHHARPQATALAAARVSLVISLIADTRYRQNMRWLMSPVILTCSAMRAGMMLNNVNCMLYAVFSHVPALPPVSLPPMSLPLDGGSPSPAVTGEIYFARHPNECSCGASIQNHSLAVSIFCCMKLILCNAYPKAGSYIPGFLSNEFLFHLVLSNPEDFIR